MFYLLGWLFGLLLLLGIALLCIFVIVVIAGIVIGAWEAIKERNG